MTGGALGNAQLACGVVAVLSLGAHPPVRATAMVSNSAPNLPAAQGARSGAAFSGIELREQGGKLVVWRVMPGPVDGNLLASATVMRGDVVESIDGAAASMARWNEAHAKPHGSTIEITYREGSPRGWNGSPSESGALRSISVTLDDPAAWRGTVGTGELGPLDAALRAADGGAATMADIDERRAWNDALAAPGPLAKERASRLRAALAQVPERLRDPSTPPLLRAALAQPEQLAPRVERAVPAAEEWRAAPFRAAARLVTALAGEPLAPLPEAHGTFQVGHADAAVWYLDFLLNESRNRHAQEVDAAAARHEGLRPLVVDRLDDLLVRGPHARTAMESLRSIGSLTPVEAARIVAHFDVVPAIAPELAASEAVELPAALQGAVSGSILNASEIPELGWVVVGGPGDNEYDLARVAAVFDVAGNDRYGWTQRGPAHRLVVDLSGDDVHRGAAAAAIGCVAAIDDHAGNDRYEGDDTAAGAALGVSLLVDRAGNDQYRGGAWSLGAAAGGAALVVDLAGDDTVAGEGMSIGVGGPQGVGAFVDIAGNDEAALGTRPSVYGVEGQHAGFGMGLGLGFRLVAAGGVGAYIDLAGNDTRRSGEFSQGCGYYLGLGILLDGAGDDSGVADRYGHGAAAHQAAGIAIDRAGNDRHAGKTAAHVGGAWDESVAVFLDGGGDDRYEVPSLSLGAAAQQALALAIDRSGDDRYAAGAVTLGKSGTNEYHFAATGLASLALFFDLDGADTYPDGRRNDAVMTSDEPMTKDASGLDGVFIDRCAATRAAGTGDESSHPLVPTPAAPGQPAKP